MLLSGILEQGKRESGVFAVPRFAPTAETKPGYKLLEPSTELAHGPHWPLSFAGHSGT